MSPDARADDGALPEHVQENRRHWDAMAPEWVEAVNGPGPRPGPTWGIWGVPEAELRMLPTT
jgi:hypothetical protein